MSSTWVETARKSISEGNWKNKPIIRGIVKPLRRI